MNRQQKHDVVTGLVEQLRSADSLIVADYRGLTNGQLVELRTKLRASGGQLKVVKNTLTRRAAEEAGTDALLALLDGPTAIAFVETEGDPIGVAKALADTARDTKVLALRGGILAGRAIGSADVEELAKLPAPEVLKSQLVGVIVGPLTQLVGLLAAPVRDLVGLLDARIEQLEAGGASEAVDASAHAEAPEPTPGDAPEEHPPAGEAREGSVEASDEPAATARDEAPDKTD